MAAVAGRLKSNGRLIFGRRGHLIFGRRGHLERPWSPARIIYRNAHCIPAFGSGKSLLGDCNEHITIYAISSDFGDRMTTQSM